jgi:plastocyanin
MSRRGVRLGAAGLVMAGVLGSIGVAGAQQRMAPATVAVVDTAFEPASVTVNTGEAVTWAWTSPTTGQVHNVDATGGPPEDPAWTAVNTPLKNSGSEAYTFTKPGSYTYHCTAHPEQMQGTVTVEGDPVETPTPTPTPTATATPTPSATPPPGGGGSTDTSGTTPAPPASSDTTPAPAGAARSDRAAPTITGVKLAAARHGAKLRFRLSEPATVTIRVRKAGSKRVVRTWRLAARSGRRTVMVSGRGIRKARYRIELQARDAAGNRSSLMRSTIRVRHG